MPESEAPSLQPELRCRLFETRVANSLEIPIGRDEARRGERDEEADLASTRLSRAKAEGGEATADLHRSAAAWQASTGMAYSKVKTSDGSPESSRPKLAKPSGKR